MKIRIKLSNAILVDATDRLACVSLSVTRRRSDTELSIVSPIGLVLLKIPEQKGLARLLLHVAGNDSRQEQVVDEAPTMHTHVAARTLPGVSTNYKAAYVICLEIYLAPRRTTRAYLFASTF